MGLMKPTMKIVPTPNRSRRRGPVRFIVLHDTAGAYPGCLSWLTNPVSKVSADFIVTRKGDIVQLNDDLRHKRCWHAGKAQYQGCSEMNDASVGIELEHVRDGEDWPEAQVAAAAELSAWLVEYFGLNLAKHPITSHEHIALPKGRKVDPRDFPWEEYSMMVRGFLGKDDTLEAMPMT